MLTVEARAKKTTKVRGRQIDSWQKSHTQYQTSMMWPSQNFLLFNGTVIKIKVNERINNLKIYVTSVPPFGDTYNLYKFYHFNLKKQQTILIPVKYSDTCTKEISLIPSKLFSNFKNDLLKMKKIDNYGLN